MCAPMMAIGLVGAAVSAVGTIMSAKAQAEGLKAQAQWQQRQAAVEQMKTSYEVQQERRRTQAMLGAQVAQYSGAGIDPSTGTPLEVGMGTVQEREMDVQAKRFAGQEEVERYKYDAKVSKMNAKNTMTAGILGAASGMISGIGNAIGGMPTGGTAVNSAFSMQPNQYQATPPVISNTALSGGGVVNRSFPPRLGGTGTPYQYGI